MSPTTRDPPRHVTRIVDAALGSRIRSCERAAGGRMAETYLLGLDGDPPRAVCKIGGPSVRTGDVIEPLVLRLVAGTPGLPVPAVLASGRLRNADENGPGGDTVSGSASNYWGLYEFREGRPPTPFDSLGADVRRRIVRGAGSALGRLHATHQFERPGGLGRTGGRLEIRDHAGLNAPGWARRLAGLRPGEAADRQPVLTHGDLFPANLLVDDGGTITALLDWGNAHVTTAGYALARAEMRFVDWFRFPRGERRALRSALRDGYRDHRPLPADYRDLAGPYKLLWLLQSADRIRRHLGSERGRRQLRRHLRSLLPEGFGGADRM